MVTDQTSSNQAQETFTQTDNSVEARKAVSDKLLSIHNVTSNRFWQFAALSGIMSAMGIVGYILRLTSGFDDNDVNDAFPAKNIIKIMCILSIFVCMWN